MVNTVGMWVFLTLLPTLILNSEKKDTPLCKRDFLGWTMWALGFLLEASSDYQKSTFRANPDNAVSIWLIVLCFSNK